MADYVKYNVMYVNISQVHHTCWGTTFYYVRVMWLSIKQGGGAWGT